MDEAIKKYLLHISSDGKIIIEWGSDKGILITITYYSASYKLSFRLAHFNEY
jgi:hypothetical protein